MILPLSLITEKFDKILLQFSFKPNFIKSSFILSFIKPMKGNPKRTKPQILSSKCKTISLPQGVSFIFFLHE